MAAVTTAATTLSCVVPAETAPRLQGRSGTHQQVRFVNRGAGVALLLALSLGLVFAARFVVDRSQVSAPLLASASPAGRPPALPAGGGDGSAVASAFAAALFSYDTRRQSRDEWAVRLRDLVGTEEQVAALAELEARLPPVQLWQQMTKAGQRAQFTATSTTVPRLWTETVKEHPELSEGALAVTVAGEQQVTWSDGSSRVPVAVTLLLRCPPAAEKCVVTRVPPQVAE